MPSYLTKVTNSPWFEKYAKKFFEENDLDGDGTIDYKELYICMLKLYDKLNAKLPTHVPVPSLEEVNRLMRKFDADGTGRLAFPEFLALARSLVGSKKDWKESLAFKIGMAVLMKTAVWPFVAVALKTGLLNAAGDKAKDMGIEGLPLPVIAGGLEMIGKFMGN